MNISLGSYPSKMRLPCLVQHSPQTSPSLRLVYFCLWGSKTRVALIKTKQVRDTYPHLFISLIRAISSPK